MPLVRYRPGGYGHLRPMGDQSPACCWVCLEGDEERPLLSTGCACCRSRATSGRAHLQCVVSAAAHNEARWTHCPTCGQEWTGALFDGLARARYESLAQHPIEDTERCVAQLNLAVALMAAHDDGRSPGALAEATQIYRDLLAVWRRTLGVSDQYTLTAMGNLSLVYETAGDTTASLALALEVLSTLRGKLANTQPGDAPDTQDTLAVALGTVSRLYANQGKHAAARPLLEEALQASRAGTGSEGSPACVHAMSNLGVCLGNIGDIHAGLGLKLDAVKLARRVLGDGHPQTKGVMGLLAASSRASLGPVSAARAIGRLVGLGKQPHLNGSLVPSTCFHPFFFSQLSRIIPKLHRNDCDLPYLPEIFLRNVLLV